MANKYLLYTVRVNHGMEQQVNYRTLNKLMKQYPCSDMVFNADNELVFILY